MADEPEVPAVAPRAVADRRARGEDVLILDVREPFEHERAHLPGTLDIPMREVPERMDQLPRDREIVVLCHHGVRSWHTARWLRAQGYDAVNLSGGIDAWARDVDPGVGSY